MLDSVWRHRLRRSTCAPSSSRAGSARPSLLSLKGTWDDDVLGWSDEVSPVFTAHRIPDRHNQAMFHPEAVAILAAGLERAHQRR